METLKNIVFSKTFHYIIAALVVVNAASLGLELSHFAPIIGMETLLQVNTICVSIFIIEMFLKISLGRKAFFKDPWNVFDLSIIVISILPDADFFIIINGGFRYLRILRLLSAFFVLRRLMTLVFFSFPKILGVLLLFVVSMYLYAILGIELYGQAFPKLFGSVDAAMISLLKLITLDGWTGDITIPLLDHYPLSWLYTVGYVLLAAFLLVNLLVSIFVDAIQSYRQQELHEDTHQKMYEVEKRLLKSIEKIQKDMQK